MIKTRLGLINKPSDEINRHGCVRGKNFLELSRNLGDAIIYDDSHTYASRKIFQ